MIHGEDGQIQCTKCRSADVDGRTYLEYGLAWEMYTCQNCGHIECDDLDPQREDYKNKYGGK